jgi:hypothetical protein
MHGFFHAILDYDVGQSAAKYPLPENDKILEADMKMAKLNVPQKYAGFIQFVGSSEMEIYRLRAYKV